ncbi:unnamed protein product, partial [marine sediment metagenome]
MGEMINNGAETIHLATGFVVGYPRYQYLFLLKQELRFYLLSLLFIYSL